MKGNIIRMLDYNASLRRFDGGMRKSRGGIMPAAQTRRSWPACLARAPSFIGLSMQSVDRHSTSKLASRRINKASMLALRLDVQADRRQPPQRLRTGEFAILAGAPAVEAFKHGWMQPRLHRHAFACGQRAASFPWLQDFLCHLDVLSCAVASE
jgi:hypothetical protein